MMDTRRCSHSGSSVSQRGLLEQRVAAGEQDAVELAGLRAARRRSPIRSRRGRWRAPCRRRATRASRDSRRREIRATRAACAVAMRQAPDVVAQQDVDARNLETLEALGVRAHDRLVAVVEHRCERAWREVTLAARRLHPAGRWVRGAVRPWWKSPAVAGRPAMPCRAVVRSVRSHRTAQCRSSERRRRTIRAPRRSRLRRQARDTDCRWRRRRNRASLTSSPVFPSSRRASVMQQPAPGRAATSTRTGTRSRSRPPARRTPR